MGPEGRTPRGVRGLKQKILLKTRFKIRRTPRGVRGLKQIEQEQQGKNQQSHSARGAWIETNRAGTTRQKPAVALREGCVD